jgi:hypothetical protein
MFNSLLFGADSDAATEKLFRNKKQRKREKEKEGENAATNPSVHTETDETGRSGKRPVREVRQKTCQLSSLPPPD